MGMDEHLKTLFKYSVQTRNNGARCDKVSADQKIILERRASWLKPASSATFCMDAKQEHLGIVRSKNTRLLPTRYILTLAASGR